MKTSVYIGKNELRIEERAVPAITAGEVLIKVDFCGLCGTDIKKVQYGLAKAPTILGHEVTGTVIESRSSKFQPGNRIAVAHHVPCFDCHYCRHGNVSMCTQFKASNIDPGGYSEYCRVPALHVLHTAFKLDRLTQQEGIFLEPLACIVRDLTQQNLLPGDLAVCIGLGSIGLLAVQALAATGITAIGVDLHSERRALAKTLGAAHALHPRESDISRVIREWSNGRGADLVLVTAGSPELLPTYLPWLRSGGTLNLFASLFPETPAPLPVNELYHREIQVTSAYSASPDSLAEAHRLLETGQVKTTPLISEILPLAGIMAGIHKVLAQESIKVVIDPSL